ncbi:MAG: hypothetical protein AAF682_20495 [Planctomycetota bacterium]
MTDDTNPKGRGTALAALAVRLAAAWILAGGLFKLFLGTPADLPEVVRGLLDDLVLTYQLAIAIEFAAAALAILRPGWGWPPIVAAYLIFEYVLITQMAAGAESCGCFGSKVPMPPWGMMAIDSALLLFMLVTRPWRLPRTGAPWIVVVLVAAAGVAAPFVVDREAEAPPPASEPGEAGSGEPGEDTEAGGGLRGFVELDVEDWVGQSIYDTKLAQWMEGDVYSLPGDGMWVLWRWTCDHCADHLQQLADAPPDVPFLVLVRLKEPGDTDANQSVFVKPAGDNVLEASCPDTVDYLITTPGELMVEAGTVVSGEQGVGSE